MNKVIVRFKSNDSSKKYEEFVINVSYPYEEALKILQIMNRKLSLKYKDVYRSVTYKINKYDSFLYVNYLR